MTNSRDYIKVDDRVEVHEGSWAGRTGKVIELISDTHVRVRFDDRLEENVVACTLGREVS